MQRAWHTSCQCVRQFDPQTAERSRRCIQESVKAEKARMALCVYQHRIEGTGFRAYRGLGFRVPVGQL